jgi:hypothetical protein
MGYLARHCLKKKKQLPNYVWVANMYFHVLETTAHVKNPWRMLKYAVKPVFTN